MARAKSVKPVTAGKRVGTKKRDMRWEVDGVVWASRFEYEVYDGISKQLGSDRVRKCDEKDSLGYQSRNPRAECEKCGLGTVVQRRTFTTDLAVIPARAAGGKDKQGGYFVEAKGFVRAHQRTLLRDFVKCHPDLDLRFVIEKDYRVTRTLTFGQWIDRYLKRPWVVWNGSLPKGWT